MISGKMTQYPDVHELLPQRDPFIMVSRLVFFTPEKVVTELDIAEDNIFVEDGHFSVPGLNENIAQTCAVRMGYISYSRKGKIRIGYIGAISNFRVLRTPVAGEVISTCFELIEEVFNVTLAHVTVHCGQELIAETDLKIALAD